METKFHFRHSDGEINSFVQFLNLRIKIIIGLVAVLILLYASLRLAGYLTNETNKKNMRTYHSAESMSDLNQTFSAFLLALFTVTVFVKYRSERFKSFCIDETGFKVYFKDKLKQTIFFNQCVGYKLILKDKKVNLVILYNKYGNWPLSFGLVNIETANRIENFISNKIKKFENHQNMGDFDSGI